MKWTIRRRPGVPPYRWVPGLMTAGALVMLGLAFGKAWQADQHLTAILIAIAAVLISAAGALR